MNQYFTKRSLVLLLILNLAYSGKGYDKSPMIEAIPAYVRKVLVGIASLRVEQQYLAYVGMFPRHSVSLHIQIISFQIWMELRG